MFLKGDDKRSVIMQNMQNMHNMQSRQYAEYAKYAKYGEYAEYDEYDEYADNAKYGKDAKYFLFRFSSPNIFLLFPLRSKNGVLHQTHQNVIKSNVQCLHSIPRTCLS